MSEWKQSLAQVCLLIATVAWAAQGEITRAVVTAAAMAVISCIPQKEASGDE